MHPPTHPSVHPSIHPSLTVNPSIPSTPPHPLPLRLFPKAANNPLHLQKLRTLQPAKSRACDLASMTTESGRKREKCWGRERERGLSGEGDDERAREMEKREGDKERDDCGWWRYQTHWKHIVNLGPVWGPGPRLGTGLSGYFSVAFSPQWCHATCFPRTGTGRRGRLEAMLQRSHSIMLYTFYVFTYQHIILFVNMYWSTQIYKRVEWWKYTIYTPGVWNSNYIEATGQVVLSTLTQHREL